MKLFKSILLSIALLGVSVSAYGAFPYTMGYTPDTGDTIIVDHYNSANSTHINNNIPESIDDYSANATEMETVTDPYPASVVSLPTTLAGELERIRYQILALALKWDSTATKWEHDIGTAPVLGTPASGVLTNCTGTAAGLTAGAVSTITGLAPDTATTQAAQPNITSVGTLTTLSVDNVTINGNTISSTAGTDLNITPLAGQQIVLDGTTVIDAGVITGATSITSTAFVGDVTGNADTVTTNANLTGVITSSGNTTSINSQTGTGSQFVVSQSPTIVTPTIASMTNAQHDHSNAANGGTLGTPSFSAHRNGIDTTYGIADATWTKLRLRSEDFDVTGDFVPDADDNGTATESRFTPSVAGKYMLTASILSASSLADTTRIIVAIYKNGVVEKSGYNRASGSQTTAVAVTALVEADGVSDYFEVFVWHGSGVSEEIDGSISATYFQGFKIAD